MPFIECLLSAKHNFNCFMWIDLISSHKDFQMRKTDTRDFKYLV